MDWNLFSLGCGVMAAICIGGIFFLPVWIGAYAIIVAVIMLVLSLFGFSLAISDMKKKLAKKK